MAAANVASFGGSVDGLFISSVVCTGFFFFLTEGILVWNIYRFAYVPGRKSPYVHGNHKLEILW